MPDELMPYQIIEAMADARESWSDAEVLSDLASVPPLADEDDSCWEDDHTNTVAYRYIALWEVSAIRKLKPAIPMILDRACFGDPGEMMRNIFHALEAIVEPNYDELFDPCATAAKSPRPGTRYWAIQQLYRLRDPRAIAIFNDAMSDPEELIRDEAKAGLDVLRGR